MYSSTTPTWPSHPHNVIPPSYHMQKMHTRTHITHARTHTTRTPLTHHPHTLTPLLRHPYTTYTPPMYSPTTPHDPHTHTTQYHPHITCKKCIHKHTSLVHAQTPLARHSHHTHAHTPSHHSDTHTTHTLPMYWPTTPHDPHTHDFPSLHNKKISQTYAKHGRKGVQMYSPTGRKVLAWSVLSWTSQSNTSVHNPIDGHHLPNGPGVCWREKNLLPKG